MNIFRILLISLTLAAPAFGQTVTLPQQISVLLASGSVEVEDQRGKKRVIDKDNSGNDALKVIRLGKGESLQTTKATSCDLVIPGTGTMRLQPESRVKLPATPDAEPKKQRSLELLKGKLFLDVDAAGLKASNQQFRLKTPTTILAVKGTRFFAATNEAGDTAALHQGSVVVLESTSGKFVTLRPGNALESKVGAIGKPRRLSPEEVAESALYQEFALDFTLAERGRRKFEKKYSIRQKDPEGKDVVTLDEKQRLKLISVGQTKEKTLKIRVLPLPDAPKNAHFSAQAFINIKPPSREVPVGLSFSLRSNGVRFFYLRGVVKELKGVSYGFPEGLRMEIPTGTPPDQWVQMFVPVTAMKETVAKEELVHLDICNCDGYLKEGEKEYTLEITPISVATRPRK